MVEKVKIALLFSFIFFVVTSLFAPSTFAAMVALTGKVNDSTNAPVSSRIIIKDAKTQGEVATIPTDPFGNYVAPVTPGTYLLTVVPAAGSGISQTTKKITVTGNTVENISFSTSSKLPGSTQSKKQQFGAVSSIVLFEILIVLIIIVGFILWRRKLIRFSN